MQVHFQTSVLFICTKMKMTPMLCLLFFKGEERMEGLVCLVMYDIIKMTLLLRQIHYKTLKIVFSKKFFLKILSFALAPRPKMTPMLCLLLFEGEAEKETLVCLVMYDVTMTLLFKQLHYTTLRMVFSCKSISKHLCFSFAPK